jgi:hypothetical protein
MGRLSAVITAASLLALASPAGAAELTRVATAAEPDNAFSLDFSVRWERTQKQATITRERTTGATPFARVEDLAELRYSEISNLIIPRVAAGLYQDVELHFEMPYHLGREVSWKYASGITLQGESSVTTPGVDANGAACTTDCPLFPAGVRNTTVYHGGVAGDLKVGLAWGIFNDRKDDTKPFWLVGLDVTFPTAALYDPWAGRTYSQLMGPLSPYNLPAHQAGVGQKIWKFDLQTALSKRMGPIDPYFKAHLTLPRHFSSTYSNCDHVNDPSPGAPPVTTGPFGAAANCALPQWKDAAGAQLPWNTGLLFGVELVPIEDKVEGQRLVIDLRATAEYTSAGRWYNELTDATGKLHQTGSSMQLGGLVSFLFRASRHVAVQGQAAYAWETSHLLTGEPIGANGSADQNPNFDWRWDAPGRRFRLSSASVLTLQVSGILSF